MAKSRLTRHSRDGGIGSVDIVMNDEGVEEGGPWRQTRW